MFVHCVDKKVVLRTNKIEFSELPVRYYQNLFRGARMATLPHMIAPSVRVLFSKTKMSDPGRKQRRKYAFDKGRIMHRYTTS